MTLIAMNIQGYHEWEHAYKVSKKLQKPSKTSIPHKKQICHCSSGYLQEGIRILIGVHQNFTREHQNTYRSASGFYRGAFGSRELALAADLVYTEFHCEEVYYDKTGNFRDQEAAHPQKLLHHPYLRLLCGAAGGA